MKKESKKKKITEQTDQHEQNLLSTKKPITKSTPTSTVTEQQKKTVESKKKSASTTENQQSTSTSEPNKVSKKQTRDTDTKQKEDKTKLKTFKVSNTPIKKTSNSKNNKQDQQQPKKQDKEVVQTPIIDSKTLKKDELLSLLRSANEVTPTSLKVTLISNHLPAKGSNSLEISSKKGDIVYLQYVSDGLCCIKTKKGKTGLIPFSKTSASLLLADSTPKTKRKLFGAIKQHRKISQDTAQPPTTPKPTTSILKDETDSVNTRRKERSISFDLPPESEKKKLEKAKSVEPLQTDTLTRTRENGSPTITHRAPVQYFTELSTGDYKSNAEHKAFIKSGRSKSYDQILSPILKKTRTRLRDHSFEGLLATKDRSSSINASDEFIFQRPSTAQDRYRSPIIFEKHNLERPSTSLDSYYQRSGSSFANYSDRSFDYSDNERPSTALDRYRSSSFETEDQRSASALTGRRASKESLNSDISRQSSVDRALSPITQRKLKEFSNSDRDMNKLKAFSRKISSKTSLKDTTKGPRKSSSSSRMSDSEQSTSSYGSSIVKVNNKRNGSTNSSQQGKHKRASSLSENYHLNWYKDWNLEPSDSSDSDEEDDYTTTDTESIQVKVKKTIKQQDERSMSDYENRIGTNRLRFRRSSDVSASSEMYIPKPKQALGRETNNNNNTNLSGFAQVYKTKSAMEKGKSTSLSNDALSGDKRNEMEQKIAELRKNRMTTSNSSLNSVASRNDKRQSHTTTPTNERERNDNENKVDDELLSPLIPRKIGSSSDESDKIEQSPTDILLGKSALEEPSTKTSTEQPRIADDKTINTIINGKTSNDNIMIVKSDFIAQEDDYVTIFTMQHVEVLDRSEDEWWWIRTPNGKEGFVPRDFLMAKPKVPKRKPNASRIKRVSSPESDCNNNNSQILKMSTQQQQYKQNAQQPPLAKVAPLMREVDPHSSCEQDDIALYKRQKQQQQQQQQQPLQQEFSQLPPSYSQVIMSRQKSDLTDLFYSNKKQALYGSGEDQSIQAMHREREDNPGGAARIVRRRSFSGRQKKVRFASQVSSSDESPQQKQQPKYQNSPGQILIVRQPIDTAESHDYVDKKPDNEVEIATWC